MQTLKKLLFLLSAHEKKKGWIIINNDTDIVIYRYDWCSIYNAFYSSFNKS